MLQCGLLSPLLGLVLYGYPVPWRDMEVCEDGADKSREISWARGASLGARCGSKVGRNAQHATTALDLQWNRNGPPCVSIRWVRRWAGRGLTGHRCHSFRRKYYHFDEIVVTGTKVSISTTYGGVANDDNFVNMTRFSFQCWQCAIKYVLEFVVLRYVVVVFWGILVDLCGLFIHILQGCFTVK